MTARRGDPADAPTRAGALCGSGKRSGGTCRNVAGKGTGHVGYGHCWLHGGASPGGIRMAERERAYATVRTLGLPLDEGDPDQILLGEVRRSAGIVAWLEVRVGDLEPEQVIRGTRHVRRVDTSAGQFPGSTTTTEAGPGEHLWSQMYARERRHLADVCAKAIAAGVARRHVQLAEEQGELAGQLVVAALRELGVDPASARAQDVIRRNFTLLTGGGG